METAEQRNKRKEAAKLLQFKISSTILLLILIPYYFLIIKVNIFANNNEPEGFHASNVKDMWRILVGAAVTVTVSFLFDWLAVPLYLKVSLKGEDDNELRLGYAKKAAKCSY